MSLSPLRRLDDAGARALAERLEYALESGHARGYAQVYRARLASLPPEPCEICGATGHRANPPQTGRGSLLCNACQGKGAVPHFATHYPSSEENVQELARFCASAAGFGSVDRCRQVDGRRTAAVKSQYACRCGRPRCRGTMLASR